MLGMYPHRFRMGGFSSPEVSPPPVPMFSLQSPPHTTPMQYSRMGMAESFEQLVCIFHGSN